MKGSMKLISIKGINLFVHWTFLLFIAWVLLVNAQFGNQIIYIAWTLVFVLFVLFSVILHELGHALVAARFGITAHNIILLPIGGIASIEKFPRNPKQELLISITGPLVNLLIAFLLGIYLFPLQEGLKDPGNISITHGHDLVYNLFIVNVALGLFNLIPAFPMDGGRILRALLGFRLNYVRSTRVTAIIGKIVASLFIISGIISYNIILSLIGIFIIFSAGTEEYYLRLKSLVEGLHFKDVVMYEYNSLQAGTSVKEAADSLMNNHNKCFLVMENNIPIGTVNRMEIVKAISEMKYDQLIKNLMKENLLFFDGNMEIDASLDALAKNAERIYPILQDGHFVGVINFNFLIEYLLIHKADSKDFSRIKSLAGLV